MTKPIKTLLWENPSKPKYVGRTEIFMVERLVDMNGEEKEYGFVVHDKLRHSDIKGEETTYLTVESFESFSTEKAAEDKVDTLIARRHKEGFRQCIDPE